MKFNLKSSKTYRGVILHLLVWAVVFALPYIFSLQWDDGKMPSEFARKILVLNIVMNVLWATTFYSNTQIFIPRVLYRKGFLPFLLDNLILLAGILLANRLVYEALVFEYPYSINKALLHNALPFLFFVLIAVTFKTVNDRLEYEREAKERESENLKTELSLLRSQISPHFLFNVLNSIVALVRLKSDKLEPTIFKLSSLMQYMLYETEDDKVPLMNETEYLQSYIDLQQLRFGDRVDLRVDLDLDKNGHTIEPMLLIPFVENAFKHGMGLMERPVIDISLKVEGQTLIFTAKNKYMSNDTAKDRVSGIGLANVKRRLQLLYGKRHTLEIDTTEPWYVVKLELNLDS